MISKYAFNNIKRHKFIFFLLILQLILGLFSAYFMINTSNVLNKEISKNRHLFNDGNVYRLSGNWEYYLSEDSKLDTKAIFNEISAIPEIKIPYMINLGLGTDLNNAKNLSSVSNNIDGNEIYFNGLAINETTIEKFDLSLLEGRKFSTNEYEDTSNTLPVILGYNFKKFLKLGDELKIFSENPEQRIKVIGFLKKDSYLPQYIGSSLDPQDKIINLNNIILTTTKYIDINSLYPLLLQNSYLFVDNNISDLKIIDIKSKIKTIFLRHGVEINVLSEKLGIDLTIEELKEKQMISLVSSVVILFFTLMTTIVTIINSINMCKKEFGTYLLCGFNINDLTKIVLGELFILNGISFGIYFIISLVVFKKLSLYVFILTVLLVISYTILLSFLSVNKLKKISIKELIKGDLCHY